MHLLLHLKIQQITTKIEEYNQINCSKFNPKEKNIDEFLERFQMIFCRERKIMNWRKLLSILIQTILINIITDIQRRIKPKKLSSTGYNEITEKLSQKYEVKKSIIGASIQIKNGKLSINESMESYAKTLNDP